MANSSYRTCSVCSARYRFCPHCAEYELWPYWYVMFHDAQCHDIWYTLSDYEDGKLSKEDAYEKIKQFDMSIVKNENVLLSYYKLLADVGIPQEPKKEEKKEEATQPLSVSEELIQNEKEKATKMRSKSKVKKEN